MLIEISMRKEHVHVLQVITCIVTCVVYVLCTLCVVYVLCTLCVVCMS